MLPQSQAAALIKSGRVPSSWQDDNDRILDASDALQYYDDIKFHATHLYTQHKDLYSAEAHWEDRPRVCMNLVRPIVDTLSTMYTEPVRRAWDDEDEQLREDWQAIQPGFEALMPDVDALTVLSGTVGVRPIFSMRKGAPGIDWAVYTSDQACVEVDPTRPTVEQEVLLSFRTPQGGSLQHVWTEASLKEIDNDKKPFTQDNLYPWIPIVWFRNRIPRKSFFDLPATDLVNGNLNVNAGLTDLNWTSKWQTHGYLVISGAPKKFKPAIGPSKFIKVGPGGSAAFINPGADIGAAIEVINLNLKLLLAGRRIPETAIVAKQIERSGVAIVAEQASLALWRNARINAFREAEQALIQMALWIYRYHKSNFEQRDEIPPPQIVHRRLVQPLSPEDQQSWEWKVQRNLATWEQYFMAQDPRMTKEEAAEQLKLNAETNRTAPRMMPSLEATLDDPSLEEAGLDDSQATE
jgi:hypothetical protein